MNKSVLIKLGVLILFLVITAYASAVYRYGNFNAFASPHRVIIYGFRYDNDNDYLTFSDNKSMYEISGILDKITGKRIYSLEKNFKADFGTRVYLRVKGDMFLQLQCGGGA